MNVWVVVIIIVIAVVSAIAQTIKNQQEKEQTPRRRNNSRANASGVKTGTSDMDRFLQEIEKLRKRAADGGDEPKKATARPVKSARSVPTVLPAKKNRQAPTVQPSRRIEDLPSATVVSPPPPLSFPVEAPAPPPPTPVSATIPMPSLDRPMVSKTPRPAASTPFGKNLLSMLGNKQSIPTMIVLQEIFGPPKSQRGR